MGHTLLFAIDRVFLSLNVETVYLAERPHYAVCHLSYFTVYKVYPNIPECNNGSKRVCDKKSLVISQPKHVLYWYSK